MQHLNSGMTWAMHQRGKRKTTPSDSRKEKKYTKAQQTHRKTITMQGSSLKKSFRLWLKRRTCTEGWVGETEKQSLLHFEFLLGNLCFASLKNGGMFFQLPSSCIKKKCFGSLFSSLKPTSASLRKKIILTASLPLSFRNSSFFYNLLLQLHFQLHFEKIISGFT